MDLAGRAAHIVLINDSSIARGGATKLALELAHGLRKQGRAVTFFAGDSGANEELASWGVSVEALGGQKLLESRRSGLVNGIYNTKSKRTLERLIEQIDAPDVVYHVHGWAQIHSPSIFRALRPVASRTVITAHDFFLACPNGNYTIYPKSRQCALTPLSPACVATHCDKRSYAQKLWRVARQASLNTLLNFGASPFSVLAIQEGMIPYLEKGGVPAGRISTMTNPAAKLREERVCAEANREIVFVGRIEHEKGADLLAAAALEAGAPLRIIGAGPAEGAVRRANPAAIFEGWRSKTELAALMGNARALVMPSRCTEPFGLSAAEALCIGIPVIASTSCLIGKDMERYGMGKVVDVFDNDRFSSALSELMKDDAQVKAMSMAAFENAHTIGQSVDDWLIAHLAVYDRLASAGVA